MQSKTGCFLASLVLLAVTGLLIPGIRVFVAAALIMGTLLGLHYFIWGRALELILRAEQDRAKEDRAQEEPLAPNQSGRDEH